MTIKNVTVYDPDTKEVVENAGIIFPDDPMAHRYLDGLQGIEIGAAAHNPFNLKGSTSVGLMEIDPIDFDFFADQQTQLCGMYALIEIDAEAHELPLPNGSQDYVITSHVIEHLPNPIRTFMEWNRVLKVGGYVYMIFPKRNALPSDVNRPISTIAEFTRAAQENWTIDTVPADVMKNVPGQRRGHYWVFTLPSMLELLDTAATLCGFKWTLIDMKETDMKVGNGHVVVLQKDDPPILYGIPALQAFFAKKERGYAAAK